MSFYWSEILKNIHVSYKQSKVWLLFLNTDLINTGKNEHVQLECKKTTMFQRIFRWDFLLCVHPALETQYRCLCTEVYRKYTVNKEITVSEAISTKLNWTLSSSLNYWWRIQSSAVRRSHIPYICSIYYNIFYTHFIFLQTI